MKALTLTQPWATLVAIGAKRIETRSWDTKYRGPLAIHAAKGFPGWAKDFCASGVFYRALGWPESPSPLTQAWIDDNSRRIKDLPLGAIVATARLVNVLPTEVVNNRANVWGISIGPVSEHELQFGDYTPGRFAWLLEDIEALAVPVPAKGALGLWEWSRP